MTFDAINFANRIQLQAIDYTRVAAAVCLCHSNGNTELTGRITPNIKIARITQHFRAKTAVFKQTVRSECEESRGKCWKARLNTRLNLKMIRWHKRSDWWLVGIWPRDSGDASSHNVDLRLSLSFLKEGEPGIEVDHLLERKSRWMQTRTNCQRVRRAKTRALRGGSI
jgi:hypothetical protein